MQPEHIASVDPNIYNTTITDTGALSASSGLRTGRSPKDKRIVEDEITKNVSHIFSKIKSFNNRPYGGAA
jgi:ATP-dependent phosphoenolpyruvate carboxykinase